MRNSLWFWALALSLFIATEISAAPKEPDEEPPPGPRLSESGTRRLKKNLDTLTQNITDAQNNINNCEANTRTVQKEMEDLDALEKEHKELRKVLDKYNAEANQRAASSARERDKSLKFEKEVNTSKNVIPESRLKAQKQVDQNRAEYEKWRADTSQKLSRVKDIYSEIKESEIQIESKRTKLRDELKTWAERKTEFTGLLAHYNERKANYDALMKASQIENKAKKIKN